MILLLLTSFDNEVHTKISLLRNLSFIAARNKVQKCLLFYKKACTRKYLSSSCFRVNCTVHILLYDDLRLFSMCFTEVIHTSWGKKKKAECDLFEKCVLPRWVICLPCAASPRLNGEGEGDIYRVASNLGRGDFVGGGGFEQGKKGSTFSRGFLWVSLLERKLSAIFS